MPDQRRLEMTISGLHRVEGYCGLSHHRGARLTHEEMTDAREQLETARALLEQLVRTEKATIPMTSPSTRSTFLMASNKIGWSKQPVWLEGMLRPRGEMVLFPRSQVQPQIYDEIREADGSIWIVLEISMSQNRPVEMKVELWGHVDGRLVNRDTWPWS